VNIWIALFGAGNSSGTLAKPHEMKSPITYLRNMLPITLNLGSEQVDSVATLPLFIQSL
jgi:hypothetical protein